MKLFDVDNLLALSMELLGASFSVRAVDTPKRRRQYDRLWGDVWRRSGWTWDVDKQREYRGPAADFMVLWCGLIPAGTIRLIPSWPDSRLPILTDHDVTHYPFGSERSFEVTLLTVRRTFRSIARSVVLLKLGRQAVRWARGMDCPIGLAAVDQGLWRRMKRRYGELPAFEFAEKKRFDQDDSVDIPLAIRLDDMSAFLERNARPLNGFLFGFRPEPLKEIEDARCRRSAYDY